MAVSSRFVETKRALNKKLVEKRNETNLVGYEKMRREEKRKENKCVYQYDIAYTIFACSFNSNIIVSSSSLLNSITDMDFFYLILYFFISWMITII